MTDSKNYGTNRSPSPFTKVDDTNKPRKASYVHAGNNPRLDTLKKLKEYNDRKLGRSENSADRLSIMSSRSNLRPNFLSVKLPQAKFDDDDDHVDDETPSIRFVIDDNEDDEDNDNTEDAGHVTSSKTSSGTDRNRNDRQGVTLDKKTKKKSDMINTLKSRGILEEPPKSPSFMTNDDDIIRKMNSPEFLGVDDDDDDGHADHRGQYFLPKSAYSGLNHESKDANPQSTEHQGKSFTKKQLQEELKNLSFNDLPAKGQHLILNELMRINSPLDETDVLFSTLPAPYLGTHLDDEESFIYTHNLAIWTDGLPPILLINSQTVTVTTAL